MTDNGVAAGRSGWLGGVLSVSLAGLSAWAMRVFLGRADAGLTGWAIAGGLAAGAVVVVTDRLLPRPKRIRASWTVQQIVLLPVAGVSVVGVYLGVAWRVGPATFPDWAVVAGWGFLVGAVPAAICRGLARYGHSPWRPLPVVWSAIVWCVVCGAPAYYLNPHPLGNRDDSCRKRIQELAWSMEMYAEDHDGTMPPEGTTTVDLSGAPTPRDELGNAGPLGLASEGLLYPYARTHHPWFCPDDRGWIDALGRLYRNIPPEPGVSYRWNHALAGKALEFPPDATTVPMLFDREPYHDGARTVVFADWRAAIVPEDEFQQYRVDAR